jgi:hypothetical protein
VIDADATLRAFLMNSGEIIALTGARVYASAHLPAGYKPGDGPALVFQSVGGRPDYTSAMLSYPYQFRAYGLTPALARSLDQALFGALDCARSSLIRQAECTVLGQLLQEPDTLWYFVLASYLVVFENS